MTLRLVTVAFDPATGSFPEDPLAGIEGDPLSVVEHFFLYDGLPHLLLVCTLRAPGERPGMRKTRLETRQQEPRPDPRAELSPAEREVYERIRAWRQARAEAEGQPPYTLLTNRQAADVARKAPRTLAALKEINGIGDAAAPPAGRSAGTGGRGPRRLQPRETRRFLEQQPAPCP